MARLVAERLPDELLSRLRPDRAEAYAGKAILLCTVDARGWPHPAMLSHFEIVAFDAGRLRLATYDTSRTSANLASNGRVSLVVADEGAAYYVKGRAEPSALVGPAGHAFFDVHIEQVTLDEADTSREGHARIVSGIRYEADDVHRRKARAILRALCGTAS